MKSIIMIRAFFKKIKGAALLVSLLMLISVFSLCWVQGIYDYKMRYVHTLENYVGKGDIYMQYISWPDSERTKGIIDEVKKMPGVDSVLYNMVSYWTAREGEDYIVHYLPDDTVKTLDIGAELDKYSTGNEIECIASYGIADEGEVLNLSVISAKESDVLNFQVKETLDEDFLYLTFTSSGGEGILGAEALLEEAKVLFVTGEAFLDWVASENQYYDINCYVIYEEDATEEEIKNARAVIGEHGEYQSIADVIETEKNISIEQINRIIMIPRLLLLVTTLACISIILLVMQTKMQEYSIYYLCGHSKKRIMLLAFGSLSLVIAIPCIINIFIIVFNEKISEIFGISFGTVIYSGKQIMFTIVYMLMLLIITGIIELWMIMRMSPIEMYRRMTR